MKVGILTFHNAYNYGAVLQTYATQEIVKSRGHDVEIINYHNKKVDRRYVKKIPYRKFYRIPLTLVEIYYFNKRKEAYNRFVNKYLYLTKKVFWSVDEVTLDKYDVILIGSDQLWNKKITGGWDKMYWGDFKASPNTRMVAWSICMNKIDLDDDDILFIKKHLENFELITVREKDLLSFISKLTTKKIYQTLDPTLVLPSERWEEVCHDIKEKGYIAVYAVQDENKTIDFARKIASMQNKSLVIIRSYSKWYFTSENKEYAGPDDFLSYIKNADMVVTTSFHGTAFSIIFQKQFICPIFRDNVRIDSLLDSLHIKERRIKIFDEYMNLQPINYVSVNNNLNSLREETKINWNYIF